MPAKSSAKPAAKSAARSAAKASAKPSAKAKAVVAEASKPSVGQPPGAEMILSIFRSSDTDGSGVITRDKLVHVFQKISKEPWDGKKFDFMLEASGCEQDGQISYEAFVSWLCCELDPDAFEVDGLCALSNLGQLSLSREVSGDSFPLEADPGDLGPAEAPLARDRALQERAGLDADGEGARNAFCERLRRRSFLDHSHELFMHGRGYEGPMTQPRATWVSNRPPRDDHDCPAWLKATEFADAPEVSRAKVKQLAHLLRLSRKTVLYTGAGISAAVVGQAARSGTNKQGWEGSPLSAKPTVTHYALGFLGIKGLVHGWVQQNHDGLPQKAGFPQQFINEVHGSWFDPSNPVVKYSGRLHQLAWPWMARDAETADLVLVLGTSLGGLNADQVATNAAERSALPDGALGTVCINLQQTPEDGKMTLRFFGKSDDILKSLIRELGFGASVPKAPPYPRQSLALVPYDAEGRRLAAGDARWMWLDFSDRVKVRITPGHNIQGAKQPQFMHIGADRPVTFKGQTRAPAPGNGTVVRREEHHFVLIIEGAGMNLGLWWLVAAASGSVEVLPVVNQLPRFEEKP